MNILSFNYTKPGEPSLVRYIAEVYSYGDSVEGWDLRDWRYKKFLKERMDKNGCNVVATVKDGSFVELISREQLLANLGYHSAEQNIVKQLGVTDNQLAQALANKFECVVIHLGNDDFLVQRTKELKLTVQTESGSVFIIVKPGEVSYRDFKGKILDVNEFSKKVLSDG